MRHPHRMVATANIRLFWRKAEAEVVAVSRNKSLLARCTMRGCSRAPVFILRGIVFSLST